MPISDLHGAKGRAFILDSSGTGNLSKGTLGTIGEEVGQYACNMTWSSDAEQVKVKFPVGAEGNGIFCPASLLADVSYGFLGSGLNIACVGPFSGCLLRAGRDKDGRVMIAHIPRSGGSKLSLWDDHIKKNGITQLDGGSWDSKGVVDTDKNQLAFAFVEHEGSNFKKCILIVERVGKSGEKPERYTIRDVQSP